MDLKAALHAERLAAYARLRGGFPVPLAGATYWAVLGLLGYWLELGDWAMAAFWGSGLIFPLALLYARLFRNDFMKDKSPVDSVLVPAFAAMLMFWLFIVAAIQVAPEMVPLLLAIGMALHWPVIGWTYARTGLFTAHMVARGVVSLAIWLMLPDNRLTPLPLANAAIYLVTVAIVLIDSGMVRRRLAA